MSINVYKCLKMGYTKLFNEIVSSTIWGEPHTTRIVWITMLAMRNRQNIVEASIPGLAHAARVSLQECLDALLLLSSPDSYSRSKEHEGRRIREVDGGWTILNGDKYRDKMSIDERREYQKNWVKKKRFVDPAVYCDLDNSTMSTHTEEYTDTYTKNNKNILKNILPASKKKIGSLVTNPVNEPIEPINKEKEKKKPSPQKEKEISGVREAHACFAAAYEASTGSKLIVTSWPKNMKLIKDLLNQLSVEELKKRMNRFFASNDKFILSTDRGLGVFVSQINKLGEKTETKYKNYEELE